ncbi:sugar-binding transcriptional regulator [Dethiothermospora halolimnae]|uniref:sugar-binding transcriptional regulator n=1 Tax=Dethiothermospora halolimnae TaxID=3114390 RepID=UPI003CCBE046
MEKIIKLQRKIAPEVVDITIKRYNILRNILYNQPIGRRTLANNLNLGERVIRTEVNILKKQKLLEVKSMGMNITEEGKVIIKELNDFIHSLKGLTGLERELERKLHIKKVIVVPGDSDKEGITINDVGKRTSLYIKNILNDNNIIGVTGGSTMAAVANEMDYGNSKKDILVLPARGGLGINLKTQSNNIAATLAEKLGGKYKLLHMPDNIGKEALKTLQLIPEIRELLQKIKEIDILVYGIGRSDDMAERRNLAEDIIDNLNKNGAVAEAFGYYFDRNGNKIFESNTVGLSLENFKKIENVIGVACGKRKAEAIISICSLREGMTLITDEGAGKEIIKLLK